MWTTLYMYSLVSVLLANLFINTLENKIEELEFDIIDNVLTN